MVDDALKLLIVEDNPADARLVQELLKETGMADAPSAVAAEAKEAVGLIGQERFDAILLDLRLPDSEGIATFETIHRAAPGAAILILTGLADETLALQAVEEGAQDYLVKGSFSGESLARAIRYAVTRQQLRAREIETHREVTRGRVISFVGAKGGVGTTTVVLNLASVLARGKKGVIAVELLDRCGTFAAHLVRTPVENLSSLLSLDPERISEHEVSRVLVALQSGARILYGFQSVDRQTDIDAARAQALVETMAHMAGSVLIDLGSALTDCARAVAERSDLIALVAQPGRVCLKSASLALAAMREWGLAEERLGVIVVNKTGLATPVNVEELRSQLGCRILGVLPPNVEGCLDAERRGMLVVDSDPQSPFAQNTADLARKIVGGVS